MAHLYARHAPALERIVRSDVRAPDAVIEEACQCAWGRLVQHSDRVRSDRVLAWLARTAIHEALKDLGRQRRELSLDSLTDGGWEPPIASQSADPEAVADRLLQIERVSALPARQQRILWLHALGHTYQEIAEREGCTRRVVERQLLRAKQTLRSSSAE